MKNSKHAPLDRLKHHVSVAVERGEAIAVVGIPAKLLKKVRIYDNGGETLDRYTVVYMMLPEHEHNTYSAVGMSEHPFAPQGFGQHCTAMPGRHLGKRIKIENLPADCQRLILRDLEDIVKSEQTPVGL